jgi:hypothetical protein
MDVSNHNLFLVVAGVLAILVVAALFSILSGKHGVEAVERWASSQGFQLVSVRRRAFVPHWRFISGKRFQFFRVTVRGSGGIARKAWMQLESDCTKPEIVDVIWDDKNPSA